jgi:hypothetical protein
MQQSIVKFYCFVVQTLLNMFRALLCPSNCHCSLRFPYECGGGRVLSCPRLRTLPPPYKQDKGYVKKTKPSLVQGSKLVKELRKQEDKTLVKIIFYVILKRKLKSTSEILHLICS